MGIRLPGPLTSGFSVDLHEEHSFHNQISTMVTSTSVNGGYPPSTMRSEEIRPGGPSVEDCGVLLAIISKGTFESVDNNGSPARDVSFCELEISAP